MNDTERAINHLTMLRRLDSGEKKKLYDVAISALEKQIPKKQTEDDCCVICNTYGKDDEGVEGDYCPGCGQAIDWSVEE